MKIKSLLLLLAICIVAVSKTTAQVSVSDSMALVDFYDSTDGPNWSGGNYADYWKTSLPVSRWPAVTVRNNRVVAIWMIGNHMTGIVPASFSNLDSLSDILFIDNGFSGPLTNYMANFKGLTNIHIGEAYLTGTIPSSFGSFSRLKELYIYSSGYPEGLGPIPASLGNLTNLEYFQLENAHDGELPPELSNLNCPIGLGANRFTFKELEPFVKIFKAKNKDSLLYYNGQLYIATIQKDDALTVSAGGTLQNNTYKWYKDNGTLVATINADSIFKPAQPGSYYATITNSVATGLTLYSNPIKAAAVVVSICALSSPVTITSDVSGATYQWQESTDSINFYNITDNSNFIGSNTASLKLQNLPASNYGRKYRCIANGENSTVFTITFSNTWTGSSTTNWENTSNWSCGKLPDANTDVYINSGNVVLNSNVTVKSLHLADGVNFTVSPGYQLTISK